MTVDESRPFRERAREAASPTPRSDGPKVNVRDARSQSRNKQPQHPTTGRFVKRNGGRRGQ
jgi:hypothetical protein